MKRVHVIVSGDVQGVGYRYTARGVAERIGVAGWIRNRPDGTVEAEIEGSEGQGTSMLAWMDQGPPGSHVRERVVSDAPLEGAGGFQVRRTG